MTAAVILHRRRVAEGIGHFRYEVAGVGERGTVTRSVLDVVEWIYGGTGQEVINRSCRLREQPAGVSCWAIVP